MRFFALVITDSELCIASYGAMVRWPWRGSDESDGGAPVQGDTSEW